MAVASIFRVLIIAVIARCKCEPANGYSHNNGKAALRFGELLKPPPPPLSNIIPVPFHGGASRSQRQNVEGGYNYQPPPPPPPPPLPPSSEFKFPAPFYKQYNFNFLPPPQPFTTTPSPSLFQKVSGWLFSSQQTSYEPPVYSSSNIAPAKKDCNPCNLVPWIPVIRYNLGANNLQQNLIPTYGPPSPTASAYENFQNVAQYQPQSFHLPNQNLPRPGLPHAVYGPPAQTLESPSSTYGPPSPTHTLAIASQNPPSSTYSADISSFSIPSSSYGVPSSSIGQPSSSYGIPSSSYGSPSSLYGVPSSTYGTPTSTFATPSPSYETPHSVTANFNPVTPDYEPGVLNNELPQQSGSDVLGGPEPATELQLPRVTYPSGFKNSYGEPITNTYALDIPYPVSATAAESTKIKTEISPQEIRKVVAPNMSVALANPAPFSRGRNIHTLQPVALPNLSVSPLPPIFNARPFRPVTSPILNTNIVQNLNHMQQSGNKIHIQHSIPVTEFTHSVDYPPSIIKSPIINIDTSNNANQSKAYRNIPNGQYQFTIEEIRDVSSQASEDHVSETKSNPDSSFESTGPEFGNDLYDTSVLSDLKQNSDVVSNQKTGFADLRGVKDADVDKYRTESNLQSIDSPLLYLKPSAPHKDHGNFVFAISTPTNDNDYEIYDDIPTTAVPQLSTLTTSWDESRTDYSQGLLSPSAPQEDENKPKIVQIIVPYTTSQQGGQNNDNYQRIPQSWNSNVEEEYQGRKVPHNTENYANTATEGYSIISTTTEEPPRTVTESHDSDILNTQAILNDLYDVKEPPFDIIKLQHTIDDWTEQEYSKHYEVPQKTRNSAKYAKQIPEEYFTTTNPIANYVTANNNFYYEFYDHEGSSSVNHAVTDNKNKTLSKSHKEYNIIERPKTKYSSSNTQDTSDVKKPHIYTAATSFRSTSTTPAPWGKIQTAISPLTKEKVYVVTSKPWKDTSTVRKKTNDWYDAESFESKKTNLDNDVSASDNLPFKSPRFSHRPSFGFTGSGEVKIESLKSDSSYGFSKSWHQSINELETQTRNSTAFAGGSHQNITSTTTPSTNKYSEENAPNMEEATTTMATAEALENKNT